MVARVAWTVATSSAAMAAASALTAPSAASAEHLHPWRALVLPAERCADEQVLQVAQHRDLMDQLSEDAQEGGNVLGRNEPGDSRIALGVRIGPRELGRRLRDHRRLEHSLHALDHLGIAHRRGEVLEWEIGLGLFHFGLLLLLLIGSFVVGWRDLRGDDETQRTLVGKSGAQQLPKLNV